MPTRKPKVLPVSKEVADAICFRHRERIIERIEQEAADMERAGYPRIAQAYRDCGEVVRSLHVEGFSWKRKVPKRRKHR